MEEWDSERGSKLFGTGKAIKPAACEADPLPKDGTSVAMQIEMAKEDSNKKEKKGGKKLAGVAKSVGRKSSVTSKIGTGKKKKK